MSWRSKESDAGKSGEVEASLVAGGIGVADGEGCQQIIGQQKTLTLTE